MSKPSSAVFRIEKAPRGAQSAWQLVVASDGRPLNRSEFGLEVGGVSTEKEAESLREVFSSLVEAGLSDFDSLVAARAQWDADQGFGDTPAQQFVNLYQNSTDRRPSPECTFAADVEADQIVFIEGFPLTVTAVQRPSNHRVEIEAGGETFRFAPYAELRQGTEADQTLMVIRDGESQAAVIVPSRSLLAGDLVEFAVGADQVSLPADQEIEEYDGIVVRGIVMPASSLDRRAPHVRLYDASIFTEGDMLLVEHVRLSAPAPLTVVRHITGTRMDLRFQPTPVGELRKGDLVYASGRYGEVTREPSEPGGLSVLSIGHTDEPAAASGRRLQVDHVVQAVRSEQRRPIAPFVDRPGETPLFARGVEARDLEPGMVLIGYDAVTHDPDERVIDNVLNVDHASHVGVTFVGRSEQVPFAKGEPISALITAQQRETIELRQQLPAPRNRAPFEVVGEITLTM